MKKDYIEELEQLMRPRKLSAKEQREASARERVGRKLVALRKREELTLSQIAERMGTAVSVVSKLEAGGDVKLSTLQRYLAALDIKFDLVLD